MLPFSTLGGQMIMEKRAARCNIASRDWLSGIKSLIIVNVCFMYQAIEVKYLVEFDHLLKFHDSSL